MKPRITISTTPSGQLEIWVNEPGRNLLVKELQGLSKKSDHFHLGTFEGAGVEMEDKAYNPTDTIVHAAKVLFRPDEWDQRHFPHVLSESA
jgi:hypothetical protein